MKIFEGKQHAAIIDRYIKNRLSVAKPFGKLLIVLIGDNPISQKYIKVKMKLCEELEIPIILESIDSSLPDELIFQKVKVAFEADEVSGGLIQLPLPRQSLQKCLDLIPPKKDVDLISSNNLDQYYKNDFNRLPPVVRAFNYFFSVVVNKSPVDIATVLDKPCIAVLYEGLSEKISIRIIGDGFLVGKPLNQYLKSFENLTINNEIFNNGDKITSDFLVSGVGKPNMLNGADISENCNVLDFGTSFYGGKIVGDLDKNSDCAHLGAVSFSPGGIGPVVVRFLVLNFLDLS